MCRNITANDRGYSSCISLRLGACYALRFMCLKTDKLHLWANIPINRIAHNDYSIGNSTIAGDHLVEANAMVLRATKLRIPKHWAV